MTIFDEPYSVEERLTGRRTKRLHPFGDGFVAAVARAASLEIDSLASRGALAIELTLARSRRVAG